MNHDGIRIAIVAGGEPEPQVREAIARALARTRSERDSAWRTTARLEQLGLLPTEVGEDQSSDSAAAASSSVA